MGTENRGIWPILRSWAMMQVVLQVFHRGDNSGRAGEPESDVTGSGASSSPLDVRPSLGKDAFAGMYEFWLIRSGGRTLPE